MAAELGGAKPPVTSSSLEVETPLLVGPKGSVVTLLNWAHKEFNASTKLLELNVTLGFTPSSVESVEHGPLTATPAVGAAPGTVTVQVPLAAADFLLFHKA